MIKLFFNIVSLLAFSSCGIFPSKTVNRDPQSSRCGLINRKPCNSLENLNQNIIDELAKFVSTEVNSRASLTNDDIKEFLEEKYHLHSELISKAKFYYIFNFDMGHVYDKKERRRKGLSDFQVDGDYFRTHVAYQLSLENIFIFKTDQSELINSIVDFTKGFKFKTLERERIKKEIESFLNTSYYAIEDTCPSSSFQSIGQLFGMCL